MSLFKAVDQPDRTYEEFKNSERLISSSEATDAAWDLAWQDTAVGLVARSGINLPFMGDSAISQMENSGAKPLSPEEANKLYPYMDEPFYEPVNPYIAKMKADQQLEKQELQRKIYEGPQDSWTKSKHFGAGLMAHMLDPIEVGAGYVVGLGIGGAAVKGYLGQGLAQSAKAGGIGAAVVEGSGGALIENVVQEGAQKMVEAKEGVVDPRTNLEIATDVVIGSLFPAALQTGIRGMGRIGRMLKQTSPEADLPFVRHTLQSAERGLVPDTTPMTKALAKETSVDGKLVGYEFRPLDIDPATRIAPVEGKKFYVSTADKLPDSPKVALGDDIGFGTHLTDHPGVANAAAARSMSDDIGTVREVEISELRPLDLNSYPDEVLRGRLNELLDESGLSKVGEDFTVKDIVEQFKNAVDEDMMEPSYLDRVQSIIKESGYDSLVDNGRLRLGEEHVPHNNVILLDDPKMKEVSVRDADPTIRRDPTPEEIAEAQKKAENPERLFQDDQAVAQFDEEFKTEFEEAISLKPEDSVEELLAEMDELKKQGELPESFVEEVKGLELEARGQFEWLKRFKACVMGG